MQGVHAWNYDVSTSLIGMGYTAEYIPCRPVTKMVVTCERLFYNCFIMTFILLFIGR